MHCIQEGHTHAHGFSPYCELYVSLLLKDAEYAACHGIEAVVEQRTQANLACLFTGACECESHVKIPSAEDNKENKKKKETKEAIPSSKSVEKETPKTEKDDEQNSGAPPGRDQLRARNTVSEEKGKKSRYPTRNHSGATTDANSKADMSGEADELRNGSFAKPKNGINCLTRNTVSEEKGKKSRYPTRNHSEATTDTNSKADTSGKADELRNGSFARAKAGGASECTQDNSEMVS
ncbi:hypothetical protein COOONC_10665 [Cooperia oncophora]